MVSLKRWAQKRSHISDTFAHENLIAMEDDNDEYFRNSGYWQMIHRVYNSHLGPMKYHRMIWKNGTYSKGEIW